MIRELATVHDADDCILGLCEHPSHYLEDAVVDLRVLMGEQALCEPEEMLCPVFM